MGRLHTGYVIIARFTSGLILATLSHYLLQRENIRRIQLPIHYIAG